MRRLSLMPLRNIPTQTIKRSIVKLVLDFDHYYVAPIQEKDFWKLCDFVVANAERLKRFFPKTLEQNLNPDLSRYFVEKKVRQFKTKEELLFKLKHKERRTIIGLVYIKKLDLLKKQAELAYCIGYQYEGKGWMSQAVKSLSDYATKDLGLKTLQIIVHHSNRGSIRVAEKSGYQWRTQLLKEHSPPNEPALDMELYELDV